MRNNKWIKVILFALLMFMSTGYIKGAAEIIVPKDLYINTEQPYVGEIDYGADRTIKARKIMSELGVGYCLEIYKDYPSGEHFLALGHPGDAVNKVLTYGYPNLTPEQIGVDTPNDAYFVTQIVLWTVIEGFDINAFSGSNPKIVNAIKDMYHKAMALDSHSLRDKTMVYYTNDNVQKVVTFVNPVGAAMPRDGMPGNGINPTANGTAPIDPNGK